MKRKIAVASDSRAEYGHLYWLLKEIAADSELELQNFVTGAHLSERFGSTYKEIENDGFRIDARIDLKLEKDTSTAICKAMGLGVAGFAEALERLKPDVFVVLGDRYEMLAAASAALMMKVPIAHLHGGEATFGAIDESIRHAITKMSAFHFVAAEPYRERVIQMGEDPSRVLNFGAPGLAHLKRQKLLSRTELEKEIEFSLGKTFFLVTFHPETATEAGKSAEVESLLKALDTFPDAHVLFTATNADAGGSAIQKAIDGWCKTNSKRARAVSSLGSLRYMSAMKHADAVVGNSSSGVIEAPAVKVPTVNIGSRQAGRLRATSILDCEATESSIRAAITRATSPEFRKIAAETVSVYGQGDAPQRIKDYLKTVSLKDATYKTWWSR